MKSIRNWVDNPRYLETKGGEVHVDKFIIAS